MTIQQLTYFLATVEHGSFSGAARSLYLTPAVDLGAGSPARVRARDLAVRPSRARARADRGGPALPPRGRARARRRRAGTRCRRRGARPPRRHARLRDVRDSLRLPDRRPRQPTSGASTRTFASGSSGSTRRRSPTRFATRRSKRDSSSSPSTMPGSTSALLATEELVVVSREAERVAAPVTIEALAAAPLILYDAQYGAHDPTRRQLARPGPTRRRDAAAGDRGGRDGGRGRARPPRARRHGRPAGRDRAPGARGLHVASFAEPLYDTFAFIARADAPSRRRRARSSRSSSAASSAWPKWPCTRRARPIGGRPDGQ